MYKALQSYTFPTLLDLLKKSSVGFRERYAKLFARRSLKHPFHYIPSLIPLYPWVTFNGCHIKDCNRAEECRNALFGTDVGLRGWNEEFQTCRDLPDATSVERVAKDRILNRVFMDFMVSAEKVVVGIVDGNLAPLNPMEDSKLHVWMHNNIFYSQSNDGRDCFIDCGGSHTMRKLSGLDLQSISRIDGLGIEDVRTLLTVVVDYRGRRIVCQGLIPGILHGDQAFSLNYGYMDDGVAVEPSNDFLSRFSRISEYFHILPSVALDMMGNVMNSVVSASEMKGVLGSDRRLYLLDLNRTTPRDHNYKDDGHFACVLRHELLSFYCHEKTVEYLQANPVSQGTNDEDKVSASDLENRQQDAYRNYFYGIKFDVNLLTKFEVIDETYEQRLEPVRSISEYLCKVVIPRFVEEMKYGLINVSDHQSISDTLHSNGINVRYLGTIHEMLSGYATLQKVFLHDMIVRAAKQLFNDIFGCRTLSIGVILCDFLNSLLGGSAFGAPFTEKDVAEAEPIFNTMRNASFPDVKKKRKGKASQRNDLFNPLNLWVGLRVLVQEKFRCSLPLALTVSDGDRLTILSAFCRLTGLQLGGRNFEFRLERWIEAQDLRGLEAIVKYIGPVPRDAAEYIRLGKHYLNNGGFSYAYEFFMEAIKCLHQTVGVMHSDTAFCYSAIALLCSYMGDYKEALEQQYRAFIVAARVLGFESSVTIYYYSYYAYYLHCLSRSDLALLCMAKAVKLMELVCGTNHPETGGMLMNMGLILRDVQNHLGALECFNQAVHCFDKVGLQSVYRIAECYHFSALSLSQLNDFRNAIEFEKKCKNLFVEILGEKHDKVTESQKWFSFFTRNAVEFAKGIPLTNPDGLVVQQCSWLGCGPLPRTMFQKEGPQIVEEPKGDPIPELSKKDKKKLKKKGKKLKAV